jgi:hypothetical protein
MLVGSGVLVAYLVLTVVRVSRGPALSQDAAPDVPALMIILFLLAGMGRWLVEYNCKKSELMRILAGVCQKQQE